MKPSLSVVVPLDNAQSTATHVVETLLEVLPELTPQFEIVLVDDGSTDATRETIHDLSLGYPQVQVVIQPRRLGPQAAYRSALHYTWGEYLLLSSNRAECDWHEVPKLWDRRNDAGAVSARVPGGLVRGAMPRHANGALRTLDGSMFDLLLVPRRLLTNWATTDDGTDAVGYLRGRGYLVESLELRQRRSSGGLPKTNAVPEPHRGFSRMVVASEQRGGEKSTSRVRRPNLAMPRHETHFDPIG